MRRHITRLFCLLTGISSKKENGLSGFEAGEVFVLLSSTLWLAMLRRVVVTLPGLIFTFCLSKKYRPKLQIDRCHFYEDVAVRSRLDVLSEQLCHLQSAELGSWRATEPSTSKLEPSGLDESTMSWPRAEEHLCRNRKECNVKRQLCF